jgi:hypothetical protein
LYVNCNRNFGGIYELLCTPASIFIPAMYILYCACLDGMHFYLQYFGIFLMAGAKRLA